MSISFKSTCERAQINPSFHTGDGPITAFYECNNLQTNVYYAPSQQKKIFKRNDMTKYGGTLNKTRLSYTQHCNVIVYTDKPDLNTSDQ